MVGLNHRTGAETEDAHVQAQEQPLGRPGRERWLYGLALALFAASFVFALRGRSPAEWRLSWLVVAAALVPLTLLANGVEYVVAGGLLGHRIGLGEALRVSILGSAANLLPVPGAVLVRAHALRAKGSGYTRAFGSTAAVGAGWVGISALLAGVILVASGSKATGATFTLLGAGALIGMGLLVKAAGGRVPESGVRIVVVEVVFVIVSAARLYASLRAIGVEASPTQAITLTVAGAIAGAAGVFPSGLGLREWIAGGLSPLIGLSVSSGVLGASVDRLVGLVGLAFAAGVLLAYSRSALAPSRD